MTVKAFAPVPVALSRRRFWTENDARDPGLVHAVKDWKKYKNGLDD